MSSRYPGCVLLLIDQSASMGNPIAGDSAGTSRATALAAAADQLLDELVQRCLDKSGRVMPWCDIAAIGYGGHGVRSMLQRPSRELDAGSDPAGVFVSTAVLDSYAETTAAAHDPLAPARHWIRPLSDGITPMSEAFTVTVALVRRWVAAHPDSFPPVVLHITDAQFNTADPTDQVTELTRLRTSDGAVLLFNLHMSGNTADMIEYPSRPPRIEDEFGRWLYAVSSTIPPQLAESSLFPLEPGARGFVLNGGAASLLRFFMWGTPGRVI
ncbi:hypothetical protein ACFO3J_18385 [Streptomyces polygonati]|uniref:VWA domain-containing protein n=1 Tax=Streptomyces polygonati TaxID=1617087 RepID=A0ABV8HQI2_9ACTN